MPALPPISSFTAGTVSEAQFKTALSDLRTYLAALLGVTGLPADALLAMGLPSSPAGNDSKQTIWLPAAALTPLEGADGATPETVQVATNKTIVNVLEFGPDVNQYAECMVRMPEGWDEATAFTVRFVWMHGATTTNFGVGWSARAKAINDNTTLGGAWGAYAQVNDTGGATNNIYHTAAASVIPSGAPAAGSLLAFEFVRAATDAVADTLAVSARLLGVVVQYQTASLSDA